jgi:dephospho-CoA kinase
VIRVGLTGGIASGKSTVAAILRDLGASVFDADRIVAELYEPDAPGAAEVARLFGRAMRDDRGAVSKARLAKLAFDDPAARRRLEAAIHPLVLSEMRRRFDEAERHGASVAVAEASQLLEGGYGGDFDRVLLVVAPPAVRIARAEARGMTAADAERRIAAQMTESEARALADDVVENTGTVEGLREKVERLYRGWTGS